MTIQTLNESVAAEIRAELGRQRLTQRWLSARLRWTTTRLSRRMNGEVAFSTVELTSIAEALDISLSALIGTGD